MKIMFDLKAQISVPDAAFSPKKEKVEKVLANLLQSEEGMHVKSLSVENYTVEGEE